MVPATLLRRCAGNPLTWLSSKMKSMKSCEIDEKKEEDEMKPFFRPPLLTKASMPRNPESSRLHEQQIWTL